MRVGVAVVIGQIGGSHLTARVGPAVAQRNSWTPRDPIYLLEEARCCKAPTPYQNTSSTCKLANWWTRLDGLVLKTKIH